MSKPRIGLLGAGPWADQTHAPALAAHPGLELSGVWGRRPEAAAALAAAHGTTAYSGESGIDALFAESDAIAFAVPPDIQAPLAVRAAAAGCHLLMDKPVATTVAAAREVAEAVERAQVASVVFFTLRFGPVTAEWIGEQAARGGWFTARGAWFNSLYGPHAGDGPFAASPWRKEKGGLWDVGPHALSVLVPLLGDVREVSAAVRTEPDLTHLVLTHASGVSSSVAVSLSMPDAASGTVIELRGEHGTAVLPDAWDPVASYGAAIDALLESIRTGRPHGCDARFGLRVTEILVEAEALVAQRADRP